MEDLGVSKKELVTAVIVTALLFFISNISYAKVESPFTGTASTDIFNRKYHDLKHQFQISKYQKPPKMTRNITDTELKVLNIL